MTHSSPFLILLAGPTASGKSSLAFSWGQDLKGAIINGDSRQLYQHMPILAAQPDEDEKAALPHHLYGILPPTQKMTAAHWRELALQEIEKTFARGQQPILVGGTGFYLKTLLEGLAPIPEIPDELRARVGDEYQEMGGEKFFDRLQKMDPETAQKLIPQDRQRVMRAYEVVLHTGRGLAAWHREQKSEALPFPVVKVLLMPDREMLYQNCDLRVLKMFDGGVAEEADEFLRAYPDLSLEAPIFQILGLRELAAMLKGTIRKEDAITKIQQITRQYAKRQMTWFRYQYEADLTLAQPDFSAQDLTAEIAAKEIITL